MKTVKKTKSKRDKTTIKAKNVLRRLEPTTSLRRLIDCLFFHDAVFLLTLKHIEKLLGGENKVICTHRHCFRNGNQTFPQEALTQFFSRSVKYYLFPTRWRLQRAFYTRKSVDKWGCRGIGFEDIFLTMCKGASHKEHEQLGHD